MNLRQKQRAKAWHRARRQHFRRLGLTHDGHPRQRGAYHRYRDLDGLPAAERLAERQRRWLKRERYGKGLTKQGHPPKPVGRPPRFNPVAAAYQKFKAEMDFRLPQAA